MRLREGLHAAIVCCLGAALGACVTLNPDQQAAFDHPIALALSARLDVLRADAEAGDAQSQLALSIVARHGLRGEPVDVNAASRWSRRATAARGFIPVTQYIAAYKGRGSRVVTTSIPRYDLSATQIAVVERCLGLLDAPRSTPELRQEVEQGGCGGPDQYERLASLWARARAS